MFELRRKHIDRRGAASGGGGGPRVIGQSCSLIISLPVTLLSTHFTKTQ